MGALKEGRKALILVSEGYSNLLPPVQAQNPTAGGGGGVQLAPAATASSIRSAQPG